MNILEAFEIATEVRHLGDQLRTDQPDPQAVADTLEGLAWPLDEKLDALARLRRMLLAARDLRNERADSLHHQAALDHAAVERLEELMESLMRHSGRDRVQTALFSIALYKKAPVAVIDDRDALPVAYLHAPAPPAPQPDKRAILAALKTGRPVPGAHLEEGTRLSIR
jgi:hypothetical protein